MQTRRRLLGTVAAGAAGALLPPRCGAWLAAQSRRRVTIGGRPVKGIDALALSVWIALVPAAQPRPPGTFRVATFTRSDDPLSVLMRPPDPASDHAAVWLDVSVRAR
jgi:hypothetical protein